MSVKAMVMAAGAGTRLRPLTWSIPKPMVPIANRPVLEYTLQNLSRHGITDIIMNLHNHPGQIKNYFKNGQAWGVHIDYSYEPKLLGTAGGVKKTSKFLKDDTFLVMSGDGLTDIDLTELLTFHRHHRALGTIAIKPIDVRFEYGVTLTQRHGRITRFIEKPRWSEVFSNHVNTGIYVFEPKALRYIPAKGTYDFGHQMWPALLKKRAAIFGKVIQSYWCDVGSLNEYRQAQKDILDGKMQFAVGGRQIRRQVWVEEGTTIGAGVRIEPPVLIGQGVRVGRGARLGPYTVIGHRSQIGSKASLRHCTVWNDVQVGEGALLDGGILGHRTRIPAGLSAYDALIMNPPR